MTKRAAAGVDFSACLVAWQRRHGRRDLPWQNTRDPYVIWVAEIMLQQTQVKTVIPFFERFMERFPTVTALARADENAVLENWSGLGYYARGRNLHKAARIVAAEHGGIFPRQFAAVAALPGIGRSTASAICAFAYHQRRAILDGNVRRVLARCFGIDGYPGDTEVEQQLWTLAESLLPGDGRNIAAYTQAQMDLGATVCVRSRPLCALCPLVDACVANRENRTADFPGRKPRKAVPARATAVLILVSQNEVLLERRPPAGIWGGLWCFPEMPPDADAIARCLDRYGVAGEPGPKLQSIEHGFTHFNLTIHPRVVSVTRRATRVEQPGTTWMALDDAGRAAIPAPVRLLLGRLRAS
jgi:A/G-specific adenine glycosylase